MLPAGERAQGAGEQEVLLEGGLALLGEPVAVSSTAVAAV